MNGLVVQWYYHPTSLYKPVYTLCLDVWIGFTRECVYLTLSSTVENHVLPGRFEVGNTLVSSGKVKLQLRYFATGYTIESGLCSSLWIVMNVLG